MRERHLLHKHLLEEWYYQHHLPIYNPFLRTHCYLPSIVVHYLVQQAHMARMCILSVIQDSGKLFIRGEISNCISKTMFLFKNIHTSSAADFGDSDMVSGRGANAGACAQGILKFFTTRWLITASTPAKWSIPCRVNSTK